MVTVTACRTLSWGSRFLLDSQSKGIKEYFSGDLAEQVVSQVDLVSLWIQGLKISDTAETQCKIFHSSLWGWDLNRNEFGIGGSGLTCARMYFIALRRASARSRGNCLTPAFILSLSTSTWHDWYILGRSEIMLQWWIFLFLGQKLWNLENNFHIHQELHTLLGTLATC